MPSIQDVFGKCVSCAMHGGLGTSKGMRNSRVRKMKKRLNTLENIRLIFFLLR